MPGRSYAGGKGVFVPCTIKLADGQIRRFRCAIRSDNDEAQWRTDGGL